MAIDTAAKRRNVARKVQASSLMGLTPSAGLDTADRINAGRGYIGLTYAGSLPPEPEPEAGGGNSNSRRKTGISH